MSKFKLTTFVAFALLVTAIAKAQIPIGTSPVLIPVFYSDGGQLGSQWRTTLTIHNEGNEDLWEIPHRIFDCGIPEGCAVPLAAHTTIKMQTLVPGFKYSNGFLLYPRTVNSSELSYAIRVQDVSRAAESFGTSLPVVPVTTFRQGPMQILDVPANSRSRLTLRVYGLPWDRPAVNVKIYSEDMPTGNPQATLPQPIAEAQFLLNAPIDGNVPHPFQWPAWMILNLSSEQLGSGSSEKHLRFSISSMTAGQPVWALITATNNETHQVTAFWPQP